MSATKLQPNPVCPHCGHVEKDAWEIDMGPGLEGSTETQCNACGSAYFVERSVTIYYSTAPLKESAHD